MGAMFDYLDAEEGGEEDMIKNALAEVIELNKKIRGSQIFLFSSITSPRASLIMSSSSPSSASNMAPIAADCHDARRQPWHTCTTHWDLDTTATAHIGKTSHPNFAGCPKSGVNRARGIIVSLFPPE